MENYNLGAMLGTKNIVSEFDKSCARLESSVVEAELESEATSRIAHVD
jgi:hypothetical protein